MALRLGKCLLRSYRKNARLTQDELSRRLAAIGVKMSQTTISEIENNMKVMDALQLKACSMIFNRGMDEFYEYPQG